MSRISKVAFALLLTWAAQARADPVELMPSGPWKIDYAQSACVLSRTFLGASQDFQLAVTFEPIERLAWLRIGNSDKIRRRDDGEATVEVDGIRLGYPIHFNIFPSMTDGAVREFMFEDFWKEVGKTKQSLRIRLGRYGDLKFDVPDFPEAMRAANSCVDDLHRSLEIDPAVLASVATKPEGEALSFVKYPREGDGFDITLLYWVTPEGKVDKCRVLAPSGIAMFDSNVCAELQTKGRFKPAKNAAGTPIRAPVYDNMRIRRAITASPL